MTLVALVLLSGVGYCILRSKGWSGWLQKDFARGSNGLYGDGSEWSGSWNRYIFQGGIIFSAIIIAITIFSALFGL
jgi:hypothetical protein